MNGSTKHEEAIFPHLNMTVPHQGLKITYSVSKKKYITNHFKFFLFLSVCQEPQQEVPKKSHCDNDYLFGSMAWLHFNL